MLSKNFNILKLVYDNCSKISGTKGIKEILLNAEKQI